MGPRRHDTYQLAGLDPRERGFSRPVEVVADGSQHVAVLRYEDARVAGEPADSQNAALQRLVLILQAQGYRQLKTQISFRDGTYLGARESWTEYPDPPARRSVFGAVRGWLQRHRSTACA